MTMEPSKIAQPLSETDTVLLERTLRKMGVDLTALADFDESEHPRDEKGQWTEKGGGTESAGPTVRTEAHQRVNDYFEKKGYKVKAYEDIDANGQETMKKGGLTFKEPTEALPEHMLAGVDEGVTEIDAAMSNLHMKENAVIVYADYTTPGGPPSATALTGPGGAYMIINSNAEALKALRDPKFDDFTIAGRNTKRLGLTGEARERALLRDVVIHESGHFVDALTDGGLTNLTIDSLLLSLPNATEDMTIPNWLKKNVSGYAAAGGPHEAAAEIWTAAVRHYPLPKELEFAQGQIQRTAGGKRAAKR